MKRIVLAGGCFWSLQAYFSKIRGIITTKVGYANGDIKNPTYEEVCTGNTKFAEACLIEYDESIITLKQILKIYWKRIDPTVKDRDGLNVGSQYRNAIYYIDEEDADIAVKSKEEEQEKYSDIIVTEIETLKNFYEAEEKHQNYYLKINSNDKVQ